MPVPHGAPPSAQQARINIVPRRHGPDRRTRLMRLGNDPQLLFHAPAPPTFPSINDLDRAVRHDFKEVLKVDFKVYNVTTHCQCPVGGADRTVTYHSTVRW